MMIRSFVTLVTYIHASIAAPEPSAAQPKEEPQAQESTQAGEPAPEPAEARRTEAEGAGQARPGAVGPTSSLVPDITPPAAKRDWKTEHRFLQAGTGVSWTLVGLGVLGMAIPLGMLSRCNATADLGGDVDCSSERRVAGITAPILGVMTLASLVPAVLFTRRLVRHKNERPVADLRFAPGGLVLRF